MLNNLKDLPTRLLNEAIESLGFGLRFYNEYHSTNDEGILKQSIMNLHRFTEFSLLYFIATINPLLIFENAFKDKKLNLDNPKTISFDNALNFYIHSLEEGLIYLPQSFEKIKFKIALLKLKELRNRITHLFMPPDDDHLHTPLTDTLELMYYIYLEGNIHSLIEKKLSPNELDLLDQLINVQESKLNKAYELVENYKAERLSYDPKEYNEMDAPVYECPECHENTLILSEDNNDIFICRNCGDNETANRCDVARACPGYILIPECYLSPWNEEYGSRICEECYELFNEELDAE